MNVGLVSKSGGETLERSLGSGARRGEWWLAAGLALAEVIGRIFRVSARASAQGLDLVRLADEARARERP